MPFLPLFTGIRHLAHVLTVPPNKSAPTLRYTRRPVSTYRVQSPGFPKIVYWCKVVCKLRALVYDILPWRKVLESDARSVGCNLYGVPTVCTGTAAVSRGTDQPCNN